MNALLTTWAALRRHATDLRRVVRANGCTESSEPERDDRDQLVDPGIGRCTEEQPDAPGEWCDPCQRRSTARAELAAVKRDIRATERKMLRAVIQTNEEPNDAR